MSVQSTNHEKEGHEDNGPFAEDPLSTEEKCRLCLKGSDVLIPVHNGENLEANAVSAVAQKIDILTTVKVAPTDKICTVCRLKIKRFYSFRVMCLKSDARIRQASVAKDVSAFHPETDDAVRSFKRQRRIETASTFDLQNTHNSDALSITPVLQNENGNFKASSKLCSGLTISAVPMRNKLESNENGYKWGSERGNGNFNPTLDMEDGNEQDSASHGEETESLEVQIDPFMLMEDDTSDHDQHPQQNSVVNVRGQILYPVFGNDAQLPPLQPPPHRPGPLVAGKSSADRERAIELIKQMTSTRTRSASSGLDGSFLDKPFKCDVCPESFSYYKSFLKHKQRHTGELQPLKCDFCPDVFQTSRQLQNHLKYHNVEKAFPCDQCERSFPTKERLQSHYTLHTGNKPYVCEICHKSFAYKSSYGLHIRKQHGEQPIKSQTFKCDKCHQEFDIFVDFKRHLRTHAGEKPFTCNVCDKAFASKSILNVHSRIHSGERPYQCDCGQSFTQKQSLDYHMRRHNEENPLKCEYCGMTFMRRYFLDKHKENQHGVAPPHSSVLNQGFGSETKNSTVVDLIDDEDETENFKHEDDDDDMDSDPLKLEIDETQCKLGTDYGEHDHPVNTASDSEVVFHHT